MSRDALAALRDQLNAELDRQHSNSFGDGAQPQSLSHPRTPETVVEEQNNTPASADDAADPSNEQEPDKDDNVLNTLIDEVEGRDEDVEEKDESDGHPDEIELAETNKQDPTEDGRSESRRRSADIADLMGAAGGAAAAGAPPDALFYVHRFLQLKCNAAVNYFIALAPASLQSFYPTLADLRRKVQELYEEVGVPAEMFNRVMADNPERERIPFQKMSERRCNIYSASKPYAHGPGGFVSENKVAMLAGENIAPSRRRTPAEWHAYFLDAVYGSKWHCDGSGRPFANRSFELSLCKGLGGKRCNMLNVKLPAVATICHVVEWPMANHNGRPNTSLDASDENNRAAVAAKVLVVIAWIKARLEAGDNIYRNEAPAGFVMGSGAVRILIEGYEAAFDGLV
ncbi:unnamed protein product [Closterium sp. Naga37s-1]|nr:unnamed protein product [Closterium sp. Naga37s-1]